MADMKKFFDIFNDVYFNGILTGYCRLGTYKFDISRHPFVGYSDILQRGTGRNTHYKRDETQAYFMFMEDTWSGSD